MCVYVCMYVCAHMYTYVYINVYKCIDIYKYAYKHAHTLEGFYQFPPNLPVKIRHIGRLWTANAI